MVTPTKERRCVIYTRVSTDAGLEQDFNSLDAQREASEAYIKSQAHEGWRLIPAFYDDGGFSGGTLERPAIQRLLASVRVGEIDVILVYKVDRLTRSLADFAKLVELFDQHGCSFVSVTQAFNTTSSMGRLTLNVLLSFAQFEREVTAERIRDKIAASKKKGIWMGGTPPLGYRVESRKLLVDPPQAEIVRMIFKRYLELGSMLPLLTELHNTGVTTRRRTLSTGKEVGGIPLTKGPLNHLLRNRTYVGELNHRDKSYPGEHEAIVDGDLFEAVQARLSSNRQEARIRRSSTGALLTGKVFDDLGNRMTPTHCNKGAVRYRYYACRLLIEGRKSEAGPVRRVPAPELETKVLDALRKVIDIENSDSQTVRQCDQYLVQYLVDRVAIGESQIVLKLSDEGATCAQTRELIIPGIPKATRPKREILLPHLDSEKDQRPIRAEVRTSIVRAIALARKWVSELVSGKVTSIDELAEREDRSKRSVQMLISLAFLAPDIVEALIAGKLSRGIGITRLVGLPADWGQQRDRLGIERLRGNA